ncbi:MAG: hypothetical protein EUB_02398 [Eubacterium sp.]
MAAVDYSQVSRHKKGKNSEEQASEATPNTSPPLH